MHDFVGSRSRSEAGCFELLFLSRWNKATQFVEHLKNFTEDWVNTSAMLPLEIQRKNPGRTSKYCVSPMEHNKNSVVVENLLAQLKITNLTPQTQTWVIKPICRANRTKIHYKKITYN